MQVDIEVIGVDRTPTKRDVDEKVPSAAEHFEANKSITDSKLKKKVQAQIVTMNGVKAKDIISAGTRYAKLIGSGKGGSRINSAQAGSVLTQVANVETVLHAEIEAQKDKYPHIAHHNGVKPKKGDVKVLEEVGSRDVIAAAVA